MKYLGYLIIGVLVIVTVFIHFWQYIALFFFDGIDFDEHCDSACQCASYGGLWSSDYYECLGVDASACRQIQGSFNACASACRHDPLAEMCTMQCVQVCQL